jgi:hypothetical protein
MENSSRSGNIVAIWLRHSVPFMRPKFMKLKHTLLDAIMHTLNPDHMATRPPSLFPSILYSLLHQSSLLP